MDSPFEDVQRGSAGAKGTPRSSTNGCDAASVEAARRAAALAGAALEAALGGIAEPAYVVRSSGEVVRGNAAALAALRLVPDTADLLREALRVPPADVEVVPFGEGGHSLVIDRRAVRDPRVRAAVLAQRHGLTARQAEVLALVAAGATNRAIALALGCAESTVELHVGGLLERAGCESRAGLVATFWAGA